MNRFQFSYFVIFQLNADDPVTLIERAMCQVGLQHFEKALIDADRALSKMRRASAKCLYVKADAMYNLGDFEHALIFYHRALKRSASNGEDELVRDRINRTIKAIDNAIGTKATGHFLAMPAVLNKIPSTIFGMPWHELKALHKSVENPKKKKQRKVLLGRLSKDLDYLESLLTEVKLVPSSPAETELETISTPALLSNGTTESSTENAVSKETENAISFLKERQEFWSQFKPMYCQ